MDLSPLSYEGGRSRNSAGGMGLVRKPGPEDLDIVARTLGLQLEREALERYARLVSSALESYDALDQLELEPRTGPASRDLGRAPTPDENALNAWSWRSSIQTQDEGALRTKRIGVKDNIAVSGLPMATAVPTPPGFVPQFDATVVTRCLAAGAEIVGKTTVAKSSPIEEAVRNPHDRDRFAGGSSGGSAAAVATGQCDMALGTDQGGSIRIPAAWCGVVGLKPTFGLIPYTGIIPMELTLDHVGPIARTVADAALLLDVLAGEDGLDGRQNGVPRLSASDSLDVGVRGTRVGVLAEGFGLPGSEPDVDEAVRAATRKLSDVGADVRMTSIPAHRMGVHLFHAIHRGGMATLFRGDGDLGLWKGFDPLWRALSATLAREGSVLARLPEGLLVPALAGAYAQRLAGSPYYSKAQALGRELAARYDAAFAIFDLLIMPTLPQSAPRLERSGEMLRRGVEDVFSNMSSFNVTGHPALTLPCGQVDGLPVAMQIVGPRWKDDLVLRAAYAFENIRA